MPATAAAPLTRPTPSTAAAMSAQRLYHMVQRDSWQACLDAQQPYYPPT